MGRLFLGERMTQARIAFVVAGVAGMLLIVQPGHRRVPRRRAVRARRRVLLRRATRSLTRMLAGEDPRVLLFYPALMRHGDHDGARARRSTGRRAMPWTHVLLIVCGGLFGTIGHFLFILAFRLAPASALTPFTYMQLVWAMLLGWLVYRRLSGRRSRSPAWRSSPAAAL